MLKSRTDLVALMIRQVPVLKDLKPSDLLDDGVFEAALEFYEAYKAQMIERLPCERYVAAQGGWVRRIEVGDNFDLEWLIKIYEMLLDWSFDQDTRLYGRLRVRNSFSFRGKVYDLLMHFGLLGKDVAWEDSRIIREGEDITDQITPEELGFIDIRQSDLIQGDELPMHMLADYITALAWRSVIIYALTKNITER